jgi:hypothetical protein
MFHRQKKAEIAVKATPDLAAPFRESGYWFERKAIGEKFHFPDAAEVDDLITAVENGLLAGQVPALSDATDAQVVEFSHFRVHSQPHAELAFDYVPLRNFCG